MEQRETSIKALPRVRRRWVIAGVVALCLLAATIVGVARAVIPDGGVLHVCFSTSTGAMRAADSSSACRTSEASFDVYTRSGAETAFLGRTATAANADALGGVSASSYVKSGSAAGGDLSGTFPNPVLQRPLDADTLHGRPYWGYVTGDGAAVFGEARELDFGETAHFERAVGNIDYQCPSNSDANDTVVFSNPYRGVHLLGFVEDQTGVSYHVFENGSPTSIEVPRAGGRVVLETVGEPFVASGTDRIEIHGAHDNTLAGGGGCVVAFDELATKTILHP